MRRRAARRLAVGMLALAVLQGCEDSGPGSLDATVEGTVPLGAVALQIEGGAITGIEASGGDEIFSAPLGGGGTGYRIVVVGRGGELNFAVDVSDVSASAPRVVVTDAVDVNDQPIAALNGIDVHFRKR